MKVALIHDWLTGMRGGEKVLESFCRLFPAAELFTLFCRPEAVSDLIRARRVHTSWLNHIPGSDRYYRYLLPFFPKAIESFDLRGYELVISVSHAVAKGVNPRGARHVCYCQTPMRYVWDFTGDYFRFGTGRIWKRLALQSQSAHLRAWDLRSNARVTEFLANSETVRQRIEKCYGRTATVVYPPVDTDFFTPGDSPQDYFLIVSALEPYKRVDLAIEAFRCLNAPLWIAGQGTQEKALRRLAPPNVRFLGWVSDTRLRELYRGCRALIFPGLEDFGVTPVEAQACGRPVVAYGRGGALETVLEGRTGVFFQEQTGDSLICALERLEFDAQEARKNSLRFARQRFEKEIGEFLAHLHALA